MRRAAHAVADHVAGRFGAARGGEAGEVRHRSAADQQARAVRGIAQHLLEPADAEQLHLGGRGSGAPAGHVDIEGRGDHAAHRRHRQARRRDVAEESRMAVVAAELLHHVAHRVQQLRERQAAGGRGLVEHAAAARRMWWGAPPGARPAYRNTRLRRSRAARPISRISAVGSYQVVRQSARVTGISSVGQNLHTRFGASGSFIW